MAEKKKTVEVAKIDPTTDLTTMNLQELGASLEGMTFGENEEVTSEYINFKVGDELRGWFVGMQKIQALNGEAGEMVDAVKLLLPDGSFGINADKVVVSTLRGVRVNSPCLIECTGTEKSVKGTYKTFKVFAKQN